MVAYFTVYERGSENLQFKSNLLISYRYHLNDKFTEMK